MCAPAAAIIGAVGLASEIGGQIAGHSAANAAADANEEAANAAARLQRRNILEAQSQTREDVAAQVFQTRRQVRSARSLAAVGAGEAGVAGVSAREVFADIERDALEFEVAAKRQEGREIEKLDTDLTTTEMQRRNRIAGQARSSALGLALGIASTGINWARFEVSRNPPGDPDDAETDEEGGDE